MIAYKRRLADVCAAAKKLSADRDADSNGESRRAAIDALECLENAKIHIEAAIRATEDCATGCTCVVPPGAPGMRHETRCQLADVDPGECGRCGGDGEIPGPQGQHWTCPVCRGSGLSPRAAAELMRG